MIRLEPPHHHKPDILLVVVCAVGIALLVTLSIHAELVAKPSASSVSTSTAMPVLMPTQAHFNSVAITANNR